jgi:cob(I)alamin adenosyltransferase
MERGMIHLYSGDGKGKTTAAVGIAVRAAGRNKKIVFCQFLKNNQSGEIPILTSVQGIETILDYPVSGFTFSMNRQQKEQTALEQREKWKKAVQLSRNVDLLILDEAIAAVNGGFLPLTWVTEFLKSKPETLEVVLTGRNPPPEIVPLCDYYSEINVKAHPYEKGIPAREGIEF